LVPRHPPCALSSLSCYKDARVHCVVLKLRAVPPTSLRLPNRPITAERKQFAGAMARRDRITRSLRTQQCARRPTPHPLEVPLRKTGCTDEHRRRRHQLIDVPLVSIACHRTNACATDSWTATTTGGLPHALNSPYLTCPHPARRRTDIQARVLQLPR
jgi:hypothetical protein